MTNRACFRYWACAFFAALSFLLSTLNNPALTEAQRPHFPEGRAETCAGTLGCDGVCDSGNVLDVCGVCGGSGENKTTGCCGAQIKGCDGVCGSGKVIGGCDNQCGSTKTIDSCGICGGPGVNPETGCCGTAVKGCDGACGSAKVIGCDGICGSTKVIGGCDSKCGSTKLVDACGVCGGPGLNTTGCCGSAIKGCDGVCGSGKTVDSCNICGGTGPNPTTGCCAMQIKGCDGVCGSGKVTGCDGRCGSGVGPYVPTCGVNQQVVTGVGPTLPGCPYWVCGCKSGFVAKYVAFTLTCIQDLCPNDPNKTEPGQCGCSKADTDSDGDGTADCNDVCPTNPGGLNAGGCCGTLAKGCDGVCGSGKVKGCDGVCGSGKVVGGCDSKCGSTKVIGGCDNKCGSTKTIDVCGVCGGPGKNAAGCCGSEVKACDRSTCFTTASTGGYNLANADWYYYYFNRDVQTAKIQAQDHWCRYGYNEGRKSCFARPADRDGDGVFDCVDQCPTDATRTKAGPCGCNNVVKGCDGVCGSGKVIGGCDNKCGSTAVIDACGICGGAGWKGSETLETFCSTGQELLCYQYKNSVVETDARGNTIGHHFQSQGWWDSYFFWGDIDWSEVGKKVNSKLESGVLGQHRGFTYGQCTIRCGCWRPTFGCFPPGVLIRMADGSDKAIENISTGDVVLNPTTGNGRAIRRVIEGPEGPGLVLLKTAEKEIRVTQKHAIPTSRGLLKAAEVLPGDRVTLEGGKTAEIVQTQVLEPLEGQKVINLELDTGSDKAEDHLLLSNGIVTGDLTLQNSLPGGPGK